jgi:plasmid stabilization system protein ParE
MIVEFLPQAKAELMDAVAYYERELNGLGQRFWDEVDRHIAWIVESPEVPRLRDGGYRRVKLSVFPYYIAYIVRDKSGFWQ